MKNIRDFTKEVYNKYWESYDFFDKDTLEEFTLEWLIDNNFSVDDDVIHELLEYFTVHEEALERNRWDDTMLSIIKLCNHYYRITWYRGLTEYQDNIYLTDITEVEKVEKVITQTVIEWKEVSKC